MPPLNPLFVDVPQALYDTGVRRPVGGRDLRAAAFAGFQPGVLAAGDLAVTPGTAGTVDVAAGVALISDGQARPTLYCAEEGASTNSQAFEEGGFPAADPTNPRLDQVVAQVLDSNVDASGRLAWRLRVLSGVATGGATIDNRFGAAALPVRHLLLADRLLSPGGAVALRDRRTSASRSLLTPGSPVVPARTHSTTYQPSLTRPTLVTATLILSASPVSSGRFDVRCSATSPPSTVVAAPSIRNDSNSVVRVDFPTTFLVAAGHYYRFDRVTTGGTVDMLVQGVAEQAL